MIGKLDIRCECYSSTILDKFDWEEVCLSHGHGQWNVFQSELTEKCDRRRSIQLKIEMRTDRFELTYKKVLTFR